MGFITGGVFISIMNEICPHCRKETRIFLGWIRCDNCSLAWAANCDRILRRKQEMHNWTWNDIPSGCLNIVLDEE